jgi:receptor protein-tyrosine kinase
MSIIENALKKLRTSGQAPRAPKRPAARPRPENQTSAPLARQKKVEIGGPRFHLSQERLAAAGLLVPPQHGNAFADEFRKIKRSLIANATNPDVQFDGFANVIMIASALPRAGKTFCTINLAVSISLERDINVLLVDADVAKPHISREFGLADAPGLIDLLVDDQRGIEETLVRTDLNDIQVLPAGRVHPQATELLASDRMSHIIAELATRYSDRIVLLDSPPLLLTNEAQVLAGQVGQVALVVEAGRTSHQEVARAIEMLDENKAVNLILNKSRHWMRSGEYGGEYGYYGYEAG